MRYRVHLFREYREAYEVVADSPESAAKMVMGGFIEMERLDFDPTDKVDPIVAVDPLLVDTGEVDYEKAGWWNADTGEQWKGMP